MVVKNEFVSYKLYKFHIMIRKNCIKDSKMQRLYYIVLSWILNFMIYFTTILKNFEQRMSKFVKSKFSSHELPALQHVQPLWVRVWGGAHVPGRLGRGLPQHQQRGLLCPAQDPVSLPQVHSEIPPKSTELQ